MNITRIFYLLLISFLFFNNPGFAGPVNQELEDNIHRDLQILRHALFTIYSNYKTPVNSQEMLQKILTDYTASLDKHSQYIPPKMREDFDIAITGRYGGIGAYISLNENGRVIIETPMDGSPAQKSGLKPKDVVLKIDNISTKDMKLDEAASKLKGLEGTKVVVNIGRDDKEPFDVTLTREVIKLPSARTEFFEDSEIGYIRLGAFIENTPNEVKEKLEKLFDEKKARELILDLRYNGGGILSTAVDLAGYFLPKGSVVVSTKGRNQASWKKYITRSEPLWPDISLVVLVNEGSASASEILAGAIRDHGRGVIMGTKTFGKGSVQEIFPLQDGAEIKLTVANYYTPSGEDIDQKGINPDIMIEMPSLENKDDKKEGKAENAMEDDKSAEKDELSEADDTVKEDDDNADSAKDKGKNDQKKSTADMTEEEKSKEWKENLEKYDPQLFKTIQIIRANRILNRNNRR